MSTTTLPILTQQTMEPVMPSSPPSSSASAASPRGSFLTPPHQVVQIQRLKLKQRTSLTPPNPNEPVRNPLVMVGMLFGGLLVALLIMAFFAYAPVLCASWLGLMYLVGMYLSTESNWRWHDAQEFENRFWTMTAFLFSTAVLYIDDSPIAIGRWNSSVGMFLVVSFTSGVHFFDRFIHRKEISRKPRLNTDASLAQNLFKYRATAEEKTNLVSACVSQIDRTVLPSTINNMLNLAQVQRQEQKIFRIFAGASKDELNYMVNNIRLALLFYKVKDHSKTREDQSRTLILDLLCSGRLADLSVTSRAILLDALMVMKLSAHPMAEKWVRNIILKTSGDDLSNLKTYSDAKGDFHSLHKLVFNDIRDPSIRTDILNHIRREAGVQTAHMKLGTKRAMKRRQQAWRKVLSDVDDTLYSSGGRYPAGVDTRYPRHTLYPGVLSFYRELDMGTAGPDEWTDDRVGNLVFLSARPHVYKDMAEKKSYAKFAAFYENKGMHTLPTMLAGSLTSGSAFMLQGALEPMAQKKFENFCEYYQLYPEFTHVFVGDNGQGDVRAAELIVEKYGSGALEAAFFHLVQPIEKTFGYKSRETLAKWRKMNIVFFRTYPGAAVEAYLMGKLRLSGLWKICNEAIKGFDEISWPSAKSRDKANNDREKARLMLNADLERANALFVKARETEGGPALTPVPLIMRPQVFALNTQVRTPLGKGIIRKYRGIDGIYTIDLITLQNMKRKRRVQGFFPEESIVPFVVGDATKIVRSSIKYVTFHKAPLGRIYPPQSMVMTPFGTGRVVKFRAEDEIYVVSIDVGGMNNGRGMTGYFVADAIYPVAKSHDETSPRMFAGVRSSIGYITKRLSTFVPGSTTQGPKPLFAIGSTVETPFGRGIVLRMRPVDRVYEVQLLSSRLVNALVLVQEKSLKIAIASPSRSFFSMLGLGSSSKSSSSNALGLAPLSPGMSVDTPYGKAVVLRFREHDQMYEVELTDWKLACGQRVVAYLTKSYVRDALPSMDDIPVLQLSSKSVDESASQSGAAPSSSKFFQLFRYGFSGSSTPTGAVPYPNEGANRRVQTPFGVGYTSMAKPYNGALKIEMEYINLAGAVAYVQDTEVTDLPHIGRHVRRNTFELLGYPFHILRSGWGSRAPSEDGSAIETYVPKRAKFPVSSLVSTPFGEGIVTNFRVKDQIYAVKVGDLNGYFQSSALKHPVRGTVGEPVNTSFGSGILVNVRDRDGVHVVTLRHALMNTIEIRGFLQPGSVHRRIKAARGDVVRTPYGSGVVISYRPRDDFYCIALEWDLKGRSHVTAFIHASDIVRNGPVESTPSNCIVM